MRDLKYRVFFEKLLQDVKNELVEKALDDGKLALGYSCYYVPEVLMNLSGSPACSRNRGHFNSNILHVRKNLHVFKKYS